MPKFPELNASLGESLELPVPLPRGQVKTYYVPPVDAETWEWLSARFAAGDDEEVDDRSEKTIYQRCLGPVYDELYADKAGWEQVRRCGLTALSWHVQGEEAAMKVWVGGPPKRRSTSETDEPTETPAEDPSTPTPDSESGTTPSRRRQASPGRTSSSGGRSSKQTSTSSTGSTSDNPGSSGSAPATG
ncbi:hypothetical protein GCM10010176_035380 [Nonomuraea spiralis]|uniref:DUF7426 family protein n=1 Tax=Nonomuraea spiralis TaxID=46182 RepID=UPI0019C49F7C|nr:hypothetical protein GCM10010176_035380 [Nonomuraea spiralis]